MRSASGSPAGGTSRSFGGIAKRRTSSRFAAAPCSARTATESRCRDGNRATERGPDRGPAVTPSQGEAPRGSGSCPCRSLPVPTGGERAWSSGETDHPLASFWHPVRDGRLRPGHRFLPSDPGCRARAESATDAIGWSGAVPPPWRKAGFEATSRFGTDRASRRWRWGAVRPSAMRLALARRERRADHRIGPDRAGNANTLVGCARQPAHS